MMILGKNYNILYVKAFSWAVSSMHCAQSTDGQGEIVLQHVLTERDHIANTKMVGVGGINI